MNARTSVLIVTIAVAVVASTWLAPRALASPALRVDGRYLRDASGGVVVLRGVNTAGNSKVPPFRPVTGPTYFDPLVGFGMNAVRLLFTWEAYEPSPGVYDETYLDYYAAAIDNAASRGLYVIVDFHQDAFSRASIGGCGEGFPMWAVPSWIARATPDNGPRCHNWVTRMLMDLTHHFTWGSFHRNETGARTRFLLMLERVAGRLVGRDAVIGYDILNEPWGDEPTELFRLYEDSAVAIRRADPSAILFVAPHCLIGGGGRSGLRKPTFGNVVFAPHFYEPGLALTGTWGGGNIEGPFGNMRGVADAWGVPLLLGEFGAKAGAVRGGAYVAAVYDALDVTFGSATQWVYTPGWTPTHKDGWNDEDLSITDPSGAPRPNYTPRPYPRRIAGTPTRFRANLTPAPASRSIELTWTHAPATGSTEIFVPVGEVFGTRGMTVTATGPVTCVSGPALVRCSGGAGAASVRITAGAP